MQSYTKLFDLYNKGRGLVFGILTLFHVMIFLPYFIKYNFFPIYNFSFLIILILVLSLLTGFSFFVFWSYAGICTHVLFEPLLVLKEKYFYIVNSKEANNKKVYLKGICRKNINEINGKASLHQSYYFKRFILPNFLAFSLMFSLVNLFIRIFICSKINSYKVFDTLGVFLVIYISFYVIGFFKYLVFYPGENGECFFWQWDNLFDISELKVFCNNFIVSFLTLLFYLTLNVIPDFPLFFAIHLFYLLLYLLCIDEQFVSGSIGRFIYSKVILVIFVFVFSNFVSLSYTRYEKYKNDKSFYNRERWWPDVILSHFGLGGYYASVWVSKNKCEFLRNANAISTKSNCINGTNILAYIVFNSEEVLFQINNKQLIRLEKDSEVYVGSKIETL